MQYLKWTSVIQHMISRGRFFQRQHAVTVKAQSPLDFKQDLETFNSHFCEDLNGRVVEWNWIISEMYPGARPCKALKTYNKTFNWILKLTVSHCSEANIAETLNWFLVSYIQYYISDRANQTQARIKKIEWALILIPGVPHKNKQQNQRNHFPIELQNFCPLNKNRTL